MNVLSLSDRERTGLHGQVKTIVDEWSTTVFGHDGKILAWRGNTLGGPSDRTYSYDERGRVMRISGSDGDQVDEFHYDEQGRKRRIRHIPARPGRGAKAFGVGVWFDALCEGHVLTEGGTVETTYNERGQPLEIRIADGEGMLLFRIEDRYDADGRLSEERAIVENFPWPKALLDQVPGEQCAAVLAQLKTKMESSRLDGMFGNGVRTYVYDNQGRVIERHMIRGPLREDMAWSYNDRGDIRELSSRISGFPREFGPELPEQRWKHDYLYDYDEYGNWISRSETSDIDGKITTRTCVRQLTYHL